MIVPTQEPAIPRPAPSPTRQRYVAAFPGRRDAYQIPVALAEHGRLAAFATCFYRQRGWLGRCEGLFPRLRGLSRLRHAEGLEHARIDCLELTNAAARLAQRIFPPAKVAVWEDDAFARRAVSLAREHRAGLLLYEFQAEWAFRQRLEHGGAKILFHFHPHPDFEHPLLLADGARHPVFLPGIRRNTRADLPARYQAHTRGAWRLADHVVVASQFTARSLEAAGCPPERISVVPYGCWMAEEAPSPGRRAGRPYFLFVGSGSHRKGLHHLLEAWRACGLHGTHELVVVARVVDPELREPLAAAPSVRHLAGVSGPELARWFRGAQAFVLPTLSEGFGHVFLEALACGCPVIGTRNSMLPDFAEAQAHIRYVEPGDPSGLCSEMERVAGLPSSHPFFATGNIRSSVRHYTWERFREGLESVLRRFD